MRKLLLSSTALATAAALTAGAALADVSISGYYEWKHLSRSSQLAANDGTSMASDSEIKFAFSNKTDSGLTISMETELMADDLDTDIDKSSLSISGGFGKIVLGQKENAAINFGVDAGDVVAEEETPTGTDTLAMLNTDVVSSGDLNKITYHIPAMGGFNAGISYTDSGTNATAGAQDTIEMGASYAMAAGGANITLSGATSNTEQVSGTVDTEAQSLGVTVATGAVTIKLAQGSYEATDANEKSNGIGASFKVNDAMTIGAYTTKVTDSTGTTDEEYSNTGGEVAYTIASGLTAYLNINDYDYKIGAGTGVGTTADSGTATKLTIKATF
jgi:hypothetical protein